jgi:hypothetical protein
MQEEIDQHGRRGQRRLLLFDFLETRTFEKSRL